MAQIASVPSWDSQLKPLIVANKQNSQTPQKGFGSIDETVQCYLGTKIMALNFHNYTNKVNKDPAPPLGASTGDKP